MDKECTKAESANWKVMNELRDTIKDLCLSYSDKLGGSEILDVMTRALFTFVYSSTQTMGDCHRIISLLFAENILFIEKLNLEVQDGKERECPACINSKAN